MTISYKINTCKRHLWIYESFWMHFINKSVTTSQKFTLRDRVVIPNMNTLIKHQKDKASYTEMLS